MGILYIGTFSLLNAINMTVYFFGVNSIPHKVRSGELDLYLTKPVSPLLHLSLENISPGSIPLIVMSLCIIGYGIRMLMLELTMLMIFSYLFWLLIMEILLRDGNNNPFLFAVYRFYGTSGTDRGDWN